MLPRPILEFAVTQNLTKFKDSEIILLKGHLLLEQLIHQLISAHPIELARIEKMNLMFGKTLELLCALQSNFPKQQYDQLKHLNRIRNKVAHELFFEGYQDDLKIWATNVLGYELKTTSGKRAYKNHIIKAFTKLSGELHEMYNDLRENCAEKTG